MYKYMQTHEKYLKDNLQAKSNLTVLYEYHKLQIQWLQHERLIHLMVTLFTASMTLAFAALSIILQNLLMLLLFFITTILLLFYFVHYYRLENGVQRWYTLSNELYEKMLEEDSKHDFTKL
jgi:hypothetical protein